MLSTKYPSVPTFFITLLSFLSPSTSKFPLKFYILSTQQWAEMIVLMKSVFDTGSVMYLECLFPWAFQPREPGMNSYFGKYLSGQTRLPHCPHCLSLFIQLKSCTCLLYSQAWISRSQMMLKWVEKLFGGGKEWKLLLYYCYIENYYYIDIMCNEGAVLWKGIMTLGGYKEQLWEQFYGSVLLGSLIFCDFPHLLVGTLIIY